LTGKAILFMHLPLVAKENPFCSSLPLSLSLSPSFPNSLTNIGEQKRREGEKEKERREEIFWEPPERHREEDPVCLSGFALSLSLSLSLF